jgi:hypothetical protein
MLAVSRGSDNLGFRLHSFDGANQRYAIGMWQPDVAQHALTEFISWAKEVEAVCVKKSQQTRKTRLPYVVTPAM